MSLRVLQLAADARWVRLGGKPMRRYGVPEGGPFDRISWAWCVALTGASQALEIGPFGALFRCERAISVAITGAERAIRVGDRQIGSGLHVIEAGQTVELGAVSRGARSYFSLAGASESEYVQAPRRDDLLVGQRLDLNFHLGERPPSLTGSSIRVISGPESRFFDLDAFTSQDWRVALEADRMGIRLDGPPLISTEALGERPSEPQVVGVIQVTVGGTPIIIGPDGPTIGGYPKIAVVIDADRDMLGQLVPNALVRFVLVDMATAAESGRLYRARLRDALAMRLQGP